MRSFFGFFFGIVILAILVCACDKPVNEYNSDFEGKWRTELIYDSLLNSSVMSEIVIDGKDGSFMNTCNPCGVELCNCLSFQSGKAVMNADKTQMKIGSNSYPLTINEEPNVDVNGAWTMKIHGLRYYRQ